MAIYCTIQGYIPSSYMLLKHSPLWLTHDTHKHFDIQEAIAIKHNTVLQNACLRTPFSGSRIQIIKKFSYFLCDRLHFLSPRDMSKWKIQIFKKLSYFLMWYTELLLFEGWTMGMATSWNFTFEMAQHTQLNCIASHLVMSKYSKSSVMC